MNCWKCPVCNIKNFGKICRACGFGKATPCPDCVRLKALLEKLWNWHKESLDMGIGEYSKTRDELEARIKQEGIE